MSRRHTKRLYRGDHSFNTGAIPFQVRTAARVSWFNIRFRFQGWYWKRLSDYGRIKGIPGYNPVSECRIQRSWISWRYGALGFRMALYRNRPYQYYDYDSGNARMRHFLNSRFSNRPGDAFIRACSPRACFKKHSSLYIKTSPAVAYIGLQLLYLVAFVLTSLFNKGLAVDAFSRVIWQFESTCI